jgi:hypothetical protein
VGERGTVPAPMMMTLMPVLGFGPSWWAPSVPFVSREDIVGDFVWSFSRKVTYTVRKLPYQDKRVAQRDARRQEGKKARIWFRNMQTR